MSQILRQIGSSVKIIDDYGNMFRLYYVGKEEVIICPEMEDGLWNDIWNDAFDQIVSGKILEIGKNVENCYVYRTAQFLRENVETAYKYYFEKKFVWGDEVKWVEDNLGAKGKKEIKLMKEDLDKNFFFDV